MTPERVNRRALGRATLARQLLLARAETDIVDAVDRVVGLQAQVPRDPYVGLWARVAGFTPPVLEQRLLDRRLVRIVLMRGTIHLVSAADCLGLRALVQPVLDAELRRHRDHAPRLADVDLAPVLEFARRVLAEQPRTGPQLRAALAERFPDLDAAAFAYACRNHLALVQVPPRGLWDRSGAVTTTTAEAWLGRPIDPAPSIDALVLRYFAAFGPATVADVGAWTRLTGLREVVDRLGPELRTVTDEGGRVLFDVPDAARPAADVDAPVRFLPEYDNVLLSHADRSRFGTDEDRARLAAGDRPGQGSVLHDGQVRATWRVERPPDAPPILVVDHLVPSPKRALAQITSEGRALLRLLAPDDRDADVRLVPLD